MTSDSSNGDSRTTSLPMFYSDGMLGIGAGAYTSRVVLGTNDGVSDNANPSLTLVMPTQALYGMALTIIATLRSEESIEQMKSFHSVLESILSAPMDQLEKRFHPGPSAD